MGKVIIYTSENCGPCQSLRELIARGKLKEDAEIVNIETDEGFDRFSREVLSQGDSEVPSAFLNGQKCAIKVDEDTEEIVIECPKATPSSSPSN
ncbi:MAG: glutaredoxin domain-containing protein [Dehalococcoidia bacterium]